MDERGELHARAARGGDALPGVGSRGLTVDRGPSTVNRLEPPLPNHARAERLTSEERLALERRPIQQHLRLRVYRVQPSRTSAVLETSAREIAVLLHAEERVRVEILAA